MVAEIHIGPRSVVQHDVLGELARFIRDSRGCDSKDGDEAVGFA
jgi:hypothetical protein